MTHSLHRSGTTESLKGDYVWFMYQAQGVNDTNIKEKAEHFIAAAELVGSENWGDVKTGPKVSHSVDEIKKNVSNKSRLRGVFTKRDQVVEFLQVIKEKDLGISVVISGLLDEVLPACEDAGVIPHTINYSLGIFGKKELLPKEEILDITTMCGHHMVPANLVSKLVEDVNKDKITAKDAAWKLATYCPCGIFNQVRAEELIKDLKNKSK